MAILLHHSFCRRNCVRQGWTFDLDLDVVELRHRGTICVLHVSGNNGQNARRDRYDIRKTQD